MARASLVLCPVMMIITSLWQEFYLDIVSGHNDHDKLKQKSSVVHKVYKHFNIYCKRAPQEQDIGLLTLSNSWRCFCSTLSLEHKKNTR